MTPYHEQITHSDGSVSVKVFPGGPWEVLRGAANGGTSHHDCQACKFVDDQNRFIGDFHRESVAKVRREGRP